LALQAIGCDVTGDLGMGISPGNSMLEGCAICRNPQARRKMTPMCVILGISSILSVSCDATVGKMETDLEFLSPRF
jgi:hypothetical protein